MKLTDKPEVTQTVENVEEKKEKSLAALAHKVAARLSDRLLEIRKTVDRQMDDVLPHVLKIGLGLEDMNGCSDHKQFKLLKTNGFRGLLQRLVEAAASLHAEKNFDEAFALLISTLKIKDNWSAEFQKLIVDSYCSAYKFQISKHIMLRFDACKIDAEAGVNTINTEVFNEINDAIVNMNMLHSNLLQQTISNLTCELEEEREYQRNRRNR